MFLSRDELIELTGRRNCSLQIKWLSQHGYKFDISAIGKPVVLKTFIEDKLGVSKLSKTPQQEPDFSYFGKNYA